MPLAEDHRLLLIPDVIAGGHYIGAGADRLEKDVFGDAEPAGCVLAIDDDEVELEIAHESREALPDGHAARLAHHIPQKQKSHAGQSRLDQGNLDRLQIVHVVGSMNLEQDVAESAHNILIPL